VATYKNLYIGVMG